MTRKELDYVKMILTRVKDRDSKVALAIAYVDKDLAYYESRRGQLREQYEEGERERWSM